MKTFFVTVLFFVSTIYVQAQDPAFYSSVDNILKTHVNNGLVNYKALKSNPAEINKVVSMIKSTDLSSLNDDEFVAFVVNAYNILVIYSMLDNYPVEGPLKVEGFFSDKSFSISKVVLGLDDLEKKILFGKSKDSRLHFALSCGAIGCPPLSNEVFRPATIEAQLAAQSKKSINSSDFIRIDRSKRVVELSQIFEWYGSHFGTTKKQRIAYINKYLDKPVSEDYKVKFYTYDWNLNDWKK